MPSDSRRRTPFARSIRKLSLAVPLLIATGCAVIDGRSPSCTGGNGSGSCDTASVTTSGVNRGRDDTAVFPPPPPEAPQDIAAADAAGTSPDAASIAMPDAEPRPASPPSMAAPDPEPLPPSIVARTDVPVSRPSTGADIPQPVPPIAPPPRRESLRLSAETLFGVGAFRLTAKGRASLDEIAEYLRREPYTQVQVTGFADRSGAAGENRRTAERRAQAVRAYLLSRGVPAKKLRTDAQGASAALVGPEDCMRLKGAPRAACFQPDRRVRIRVFG